MQVLYKNNTTTDKVTNYDRVYTYSTSTVPLTLLVITRRHSSVVSIAACMPLKKSLTMVCYIKNTAVETMYTIH